MVNSAKDYEDIQAIKRVEKIYVLKDTGTELVYGRFSDDKNPMDVKPWEVYDILYEGAPAEYEMGLLLMASGKFEDARKQLELAGKQMDKSGKVFSTTKAYRNYIDDKLLTCAIGLGERDTTKHLLDKLSKSGDAHAHVRSAIMYLELLSEGEAEDGKLMGKMADSLLKLPLPPLLKGKVLVMKVLAQANEKNYDDAKKGLAQILTDYADHASIVVLAQKADTDIIIFKQKNYREGIKYFKKLLEKNTSAPSPDTLMKMAECYFFDKDYSRARWNYLQAFMSESDLVRRQKIIERIGELKDKFPGEPTSENLSAYFAAIKELHEKQKN